MSNIFNFSVGKKLIMSIAGLFLATFLLFHLGVNLLLLFEDKHEIFNKIANFLAKNILIKVFEFLIFGGFLLHIIYGVIISVKNLLARPIGYEITNNSQKSFFSKYMFHTAIVVFIFLILHLFDFYVKAKFVEGGVKEIFYDGKLYHDLATLVVTRFKIWWVDIIYVISLLILGFHLHHGIQSAFQTLGINHKIYSPIIKFIGLIYSIIVPLGFMLIPIIVYIKG